MCVRRHNLWPSDKNMKSDIYFDFIRHLNMSPKYLTLGLHCFAKNEQICPSSSVNEIQIPYDKHHKVSSLHIGERSPTHTVLSSMKKREMSNNPAIYEVISKQYLSSILDKWEYIIIAFTTLKFHSLWKISQNSITSEVVNASPLHKFVR